MLVGMAHAPTDRRSALRSQQRRNCRHFLASQVASQSGTWLQFVALAWLAAELTGSGAALGWVAVATFGPLLVLGPWTGALADRVDKHRLLIATQLLIVGQAIALGAVVIAGVSTLAFVYVLTLGSRSAACRRKPGPPSLRGRARRRAQDSACGEPDQRDHRDGSGPRPGHSWCTDRLGGYRLVLHRHRRQLSARADRPGADRARRATHLRADAGPGSGAGLRYAWSVPELRITLLLTGVLATFGLNHQVLIPLLANQTFDEGVSGYTLLYTAIGVGSVFGALSVARRRRIDVRFLVGAVIAFAMANGLLALSPNLVLAVAASAATGATATVFVTASTALLQQRCAPVMRGRVMALAAMMIVGGLPIGGPIVGWIADAIGPRAGVAVGSAVALLAGVIVLRHLPRHNTSRTRPVQGLLAVRA